MTLFRKIRWLMSRTRKRAELEEELQFHLDAEREEREAGGAPPADAAREARIDFGSVAVVREDTRAAWGWRRLDELGQDLRYAFRTMRRSPGFAVLAVLSLTLGIGVNTAIFGFVEAMLLRQLPILQPEQLVRMRWHTRQAENHGMSRHASSFRDLTAGYTGGVFSYPAFEMFQQHSNLFANVFAYQGTGLLTVGLNGQADTASGEYVSGEYFPTLGVAPAAGRAIDQRDDRFDAPPAAVISNGFSRRRFADPPDAIGRTLTINTVAFTIVGVMPAGFFGTDPGKAVDVYVPLHANVLMNKPAAGARTIFSEASTFWLEIMARRRPDVSLERIQAELGPPFQQMSDDLKAHSHRWNQAPSLEVVEGRDGIDGLRRAYRTPLFMLFALAGLILTLACTNIANLLLARSSARAREIAVRLSVGAGRARLVRQLVTESLLLSGLGGLLGITVAFWTQSWVSARLNTSVVPFGVNPTLNWKVLGVTLALSVVAGLVFGLAPALQATRGHTIAGWKDQRSVSPRSSWRRRSPRQLLLAAQIAITLVLLVAAGLFLRTLRNYQSIDLGFSSDHVLTFLLQADQAGLDAAKTTTLYRGLRERLSALPGVKSVGMSDLPLIGDGGSVTTVEPVGHPSKESSQILHVGGGFFSTMQVPIVQGRAITTDDDRPGAAPVVVVDQAYARKYFNGLDPVGQFVRVPGEDRLANVRFAVVGVARNVRIAGLTREQDATVYFPFSAAIFDSVGRMVFELRTAGDPMTYANAARAVVREANPGVPIVRMTSQDALIESTINREALLARLCATFAGLALVIAVVGLYGTVLHDVSRRRAEIGVRMALGARPGQVIAMVLREVLVVVGIGLALGVPAALSATKISEALLFGVTRGDLPTTAAAMTVLVATALLSSFTPAFGASRVSPTVALKGE